MTADLLIYARPQCRLFHGFLDQTLIDMVPPHLAASRVHRKTPPFPPRREVRCHEIRFSCKFSLGHSAKDAVFSQRRSGAGTSRKESSGHISPAGPVSQQSLDVAPRLPERPEYLFPTGPANVFPA